MSEITKALVKFQRSCPAIIKDKTAEVISKRTGGKYKYTYADLAGIMNAVRPVLSDAGLFLSQAFETNGTTYLVTTVMHESGQTLQARIELPINGLSPQEVGSVISYYRRYSIVSMLGIAADDDDGQAAENAGVTHGKPSTLTKQLKDSIADEQQANGANHVVAPHFAVDKSYAPFIKDTPIGKCWKLTAIQQAIRDFVHDLEGQSDSDELKAFLAENSIVLDACAVALPNWYYGKTGSDIPGIEKRISNKKAQLASVSADDPSRFLRV